MRERIAGCIGLRTSVKGDDGRPLSRLQVNGNYGHAVELYKNFALWPLQLMVSSDIASEDQIGFVNDSKHWDFSVELHPNRGHSEQTRLLKCLKRTSGRDQISVTISINENSQERVTIDLDIL
jgi:hypothetical protein